MEDHNDHAQVFRAFCDINRLMILEMLRNGERCACILLEKLNISQPTLSHHMRILCDSGIVVPRKAGKWTYYSINAKGSDRAKEMLTMLTSVTESDDGCCK